MPDLLDRTRAYHEATKHHFHAYARGPGHLDWATQPNPFRRYAGAEVVPLDHMPPGPDPPYELPFQGGRIPPHPVDRAALSQLFYDSLALSAWKQAGGARWALRVNPSSGNLHPTEGYLVCGAVDGLSATPAVCHYAPEPHALEVRRRFSPEAWARLTAGLPAGSFLVGLTSIHWREAWKYGERAFRYCQHDVGHAIAAVSLAAAAMGWKTQLLDDAGDGRIEALLGLGTITDAEPEYPDCLLAVFPQGAPCRANTIPAGAVKAVAEGDWLGTPNALSPRHVAWNIIDDVAEATSKPAGRPRYPTWKAPQMGRPPTAVRALSFRQIVHQRRSAVAMDGKTRISFSAFSGMLRKVMPGPGQVPLDTLPWPPAVHLGLFVHRVDGLAPGIYVLARDPSRVDWLKASMTRPEFRWRKPPDCPEDLPLYCLIQEDVARLAGALSCHQQIAGNGAFSLGMLAEFDGTLERYGPWFYRRLFWETGAIGQVLYLEAEAAGIRGTGIGCFFDDPVHHAFGIAGRSLQSIYHFTVGGPVDDPRLRSLPAYSHRATAHKP